MPNERNEKLDEEHRQKKEKVEKAIRKLEKYVKRNKDGTFELSAGSAKDADLDPEAFEQLRRSIEEGNQHIRSGKLRPDDVRERFDDLEGGAS